MQEIAACRRGAGGNRPFLPQPRPRDNPRSGVDTYHSNTKPPGVVGTATIARESYPDHTRFDPKSRSFDPKATAKAPRWFMVDFEFQEKFPRVLSLDEMREMPGLEKLPLVRRGNRLSVMPVSAAAWRAILREGGG